MAWMSRKSALIIILLGVFTAFIIVGFTRLFVFQAPTASLPSAPASSPQASPTSEQDIYTATLLKDEKSLDRGVLTYSRIRSLKTAAMTQFKVVVTDIGRGPQLGQVTESNGMAVYQEDVPTGGIIGVQIVRCQHLTCQSESSPRQPVLVPNGNATWYWRITAGTPGPAEIILRTDTYDQGSDVILSERIVHINVKVVPTTAYRNRQEHAKITGTTKSIVGDILTIGSVATSILAIGGIVGWFIAHSRKQSETNRAPMVAAGSTGARSRSVKCERSELS